MVINMNYERKYKEALDRARKCLDEKRDTCFVRPDVIFPELKESEDERIRKEIISALKYANHEGVYNKHLAWLEKQGKNNSCKFTFEDVLALECSMKTAKTIKGGDELYEILVPLYNKIHDAYLIEKQGEQKETVCDKCKKEQPSHSCQDITALGRCAIEKQNEKSSIRERYDRIKNSEWFKKTHEGMSVSDENIETKLKFNIGDWVVFNNKHQSIYQIEKIENGYYILRHTHGGSFRVCVLHDESLRLWSIADIKNGDVLAGSYGTFIFISESDGYCGVLSDNTFIRSTGNNEWIQGLHPATKGQRDLLFAKMKDAGYEFDFRKKELKKFHIIDEGKDEIDYYFTKMNGEKVSSAWSEEDKIRLDRICKTLWKNRKGDTDEIFQQEQDVNWLKSLKDRIQPQNMWKPSKEQIIALRWVLNIPYNKHKEEISGLLDQIKEL